MEFPFCDHGAWSHHIKVLVYHKIKSVTVRWCRFTVERSPKTPVKYIFTETLRIVDYKGEFLANKEA